MTLRHLGIIGAGSIATELMSALEVCLPGPLQKITFLVRPGRVGSIGQFVGHTECRNGEALARSIHIIEDLHSFIAAQPDLVLECAGHDAVRDYASQLLLAGIDTVAASTGALADSALCEELADAAQKGGAQLTIPAGAMGAMDLLAAVRHTDVSSITYVSRKPPEAWKGTKAEECVDLDTIESETIFFEGTARRAAQDYPKNANVAATIALSGIGFDKTPVRLIADPSVSANIHTLEVTSDVAEFSIRIEGKASPANPKASLPTVYSLVREVLRRVAPIIV